ncbi:NADH-dependent reduced ferredoxin:NADP+ oxidoreductase subunit A [hydrothermal vent metagenome]|uniref:NADH-dependent reduced ferredoxin:NADP+ oxidoreductase subunit A n=1 Tax=hydrothermal vent metagenome TaxID=652676 RepID=A0A3B1D5R4_9ZZZZ
MSRILEKKLVRSPDVFYYKIESPLLSKIAKPGQFVIIRLHEKGERIPLSLADINPEEGTISLIVMAVGKTTSEMSTLKAGDEILDLCGPLGQPTHIEKFGRVILVGGGFGVAPLYPIAREFKAAKNEVVTIIGARSKDLLIYEEEMRQVSDRVLITTDDGSKGVKGVVTMVVREELTQNGAELVMAIGPAIMMKFVCETTRPFSVKTIVSLNPVMIDGTGMCGCCRVTVGGETRFACTDGPEFDGNRIDWELLMNRQKMYVHEEQESFEAWKRRHAHLLVKEC